MNEQKRWDIMQKLVNWVLPGYTIVYPPYEPVRRDGPLVSCGSGPEEVIGSRIDNPNWHRNRAANCIAVAKWLEENNHARS